MSQRLSVAVALLCVLNAGAAAAQPAAPAAPRLNGTAAAPAITQSYVLGPDDVVEVDVLGRQDFKTRARIRNDGTIVLPLLGSVRAADRTPIQFAEDVTAALRRGGYFSNPLVSVDVVGYASRYVTVLGHVNSPGLVPVDRGYRVSEILARVGGVRETAADYIHLRRADGAEVRLNIATLATGGADEDPFVEPGDKLFSPQAELVYVSGQVNQPGAYPLASDMTLRMAIARGGGLTPSGTDRRVKVTRKGLPVNVGLDDKIQAGDVIVIGERLF